MVIVTLLAATLWRAGPLIPVAVTILVLTHPGPALVATLGWVAFRAVRRTSSPTPDDEAAALASLVAELEGGASPRAALAALARSDRVDLRVTARLVATGSPAPRIAAALAGAFPHNGRLVAAAWALSGRAGAPAAAVMGSLAGRAAERGRLDRERRAATAQARATAWLIAGLPLAVLVVLAMTGRMGPGPAVPILLVGVVLQVVGLGVVVLMIRRSV